MDQLIEAIVYTSLLEWGAIAMTTLCIFLAGRNNIHTWWVGIVGCILYGVLFYDAKLYADVTLQAFFVVTGIVGWYSWASVQGGTIFSKWFKPSVEISRVSVRSFIAMVLGAIVVALGYGFILYSFTDAVSPAVDSLVLTFSVVAQLLLMRRKLETWVLWIAVNTLAVPLFYSRELYMTSILYAIYWCHAWYALSQWVKEVEK